MAEYIERELALDVIKRTSGDYVAAFAEIAHASVEDVAPVRHGRLISTGYDTLYSEFGNCTICGADNKIRNKYCGQCGVRLDLEE